MVIARSAAAFLQIILLLAAFNPAVAHDEVYYSAAECKPVNADHYNGNGAKGFEWIGTAGGWLNYNNSNKRILVCPVPYRRDVTKRPSSSGRSLTTGISTRLLRHHCVARTPTRPRRFVITEITFRL